MAALDLADQLRNARPGDVIALPSGTHRGGCISDLHGEPGKPIRITAEDPKNPPIIEGNNECLHLVNPRHVILEHLVLQGAKHNILNIDDGGSMKATAVGIELRHLVVRNITGKGNCDGIKLSGVKSFDIRNCTIENWGDGGSAIDMVGCHDGLIFDCTIRHRGPTATSTGIQCKGGTSCVEIRGSTGLKYFRPQPPRGYEAKDITVRGCTITGSNAAVAFVGVDGARVEYNTIERPRRWVLRILQETREDGFVPSRNGVFAHNVIIFRSNELRTAVNIGDRTASETFTFERNWWYCTDKPGSSRPRLPTEERNGTYGVDPAKNQPPRAGANAFTSQ